MKLTLAVPWREECGWQGNKPLMKHAEEPKGSSAVGRDEYRLERERRRWNP